MLSLILSALLQVSQPNIVLIILDDIGNEFVNIYQEGPPANQPPTPNIDTLGFRGVVFDNAYANPVCSPTRGTIFTGRYANRYNILKQLAEDDPEYLPQSELTLMELMTDYQSALLGKWHLGTHWGNFDPIIHGFDFYAGTPNNIPDYFNYESVLAFPWVQCTENETTYSEDKITDEALQYMTLATEPYFMVVSYHAPHRPYHDPPGFPASTNSLTQYMHAIEYVDGQIGRLMAQINWSDTYVILVGDNGSPGAVVSTTGQKATVFEGGINVPMIIAGPEILNFRTDAIVNTVDIFATIASLAGYVSTAEDSVDLTPLLSNPNQQLRDFVYVERAIDTTKDLRAARGVNIKVIYKDGVITVYDLRLAPDGEDGDPIDPAILTGPDLDEYNLMIQVINQHGDV